MSPGWHDDFDERHDPHDLDDTSEVDDPPVVDPHDELAFDDPDDGPDDDIDPGVFEAGVFEAGVDEAGVDDGGARRPAGSRGSEAFDEWGHRVRTRPRSFRPGLRLVPAAAVVLLALVILIGGSMLPAQVSTQRVAAAPLVGRTSAVCPVADLAGAQPSDQPSATITAVAIRQAPGREGVLTGSSLLGGDPVLDVTRQGFGSQVTAPNTPVLLQGVGVMSTASSGAIVATADSGELAGLSAAPCSPPATSHWFVGVGAEPTSRTELLLSNPDDAQAEVDLRFFGRTGRVVVPGSPGLIVPAHDTRTVALDSLVAQSGPLSVWVRATSGRVSAMARDFRSVGLAPSGADWHPASVGPHRNVVIPGVPEGAGSRELQLVNPDTRRALVTVNVLGATGPFAPAGADQVEVPPESTATLSLDAGLDAQGAGIALSADRPISAAVVSTSSRADASTASAAQPDISVQPATEALSRRGVSPVAALSGTKGTLMLSNAADVDTTVPFEVFNLDGVSLRTDTILVPAHGTSTRRLDPAAGASYLVVDLPDGSAIHGAVDFAQPEGPIAGLTSLPLVSPDRAARSRRPVQDSTVGR
jgi:Family of unknown function (DUF5719)